MSAPNRRTELTQEQREAMRVARQALAPHFPGETLRLYVPRSEATAAQALQQTVAEMLRRNLPQSEITRLTGASKGTIWRIKRRSAPG